MNYYAFLDYLDNKELQRKGELNLSVDELRKNLLSDRENPFLNVYPEKKKILKNWSNCTYYRIQSAWATEYCNLIGTVIAYLPPFDSKEKFINYFGVEPTKFVNYYIRDKELILCLIGDVCDYKNEKVKEVYDPIFKDFMDINDEKKYPVYSNRVEDCLLKEKDKTWKDFREENINAIECASNEPVLIGKLPIKNPKTDIGEKIAWLELIDMKPLAEDIKKLAEHNTNLAVKLAFTANDLYTAPLFYSRKTLKTVASEFDLSIYKEAIERLMKFKQKGLPEKIADNIKKDVCNVTIGFKRIISSKKDATDPLKSIVATSKDEESRHLISKTIVNEGYDEIVFTANKKIPALRKKVLKGSDRANDVRDEIKSIKNELSECYYKDFTKIPNITLKTIDTVFGFVSSEEVGLLLDAFRDNLSTIASSVDILWNYRIKDKLELECTKKWANDFKNNYPLMKYDPTIYAWQIK
jgi:hypothetical protein